MAKTKKMPRPRAATPKGFRDYFGAQVTRRADMLATIARVYHLYGFDALETPAVETVEALGKFLPDVDRPNEGVFAWTEADDPGDARAADWLALRYDLTAPLARVAAQYRQELPSPYRRYAMGPVWRNEKPGPGRYRQFYQCDADTVGSASMAADAEICAMLCDVLEAVGIARGDYVVRINNRKVLNGVMEVAGLLDPAGPDAHAAERGIVLRAIDKLDRLGVDGVRALLGEGRRDDSGDFTKGAGLPDSRIAPILNFVGARETVLMARPDSADIQGRNPHRNRYASGAGIGKAREGEATSSSDTNTTVIATLARIVEESAMGTAGVGELSEMTALLTAQGYGPDRIVVDPATVRGLGYYTGPVYEAELTFQITDDEGVTRDFGSVAGGGRYDDLVKRFTGQSVPATGVSIGVDRLLAALDAKGGAEDGATGPVVVTVMDRDRMADAQALVAELRQAGLRAEAYLGNPKNFGNQLKYADQRGAPFAIIEGADERARGVVQVKDLALGARLASEVSHEEWRAQPAQFEVPRSEVVAEIARRLSR